MIEDDDTIGVDLSAWEAPAPGPASALADAVVARLREPAAAGAIEPIEPRRKRWWLAGGAFAAASMVAIVALARHESHDIPTGSGAVVTARPSHVDLGGGSRAELEEDTSLRWVRADHRLVAMQPRGRATWQVAAGDKLVIDAGATVASVVASGASLRVEVEMHGTEARMLATSAVTAAAVALVTVVVYDGQVEVTGAGNTVTVPPGGTIEVRPGEAPREPITVATTGHEADLLRMRAQIELLKRQLADRDRPVASTVTSKDDEETDREIYMHARRKELEPCAKPARDFVHIELSHEAGSITELAVTIAGAPASKDIVACVDGVVRRWQLPSGPGGMEFTIGAANRTVRPPNPPTPTSQPAADCGDATLVAKIDAQGENLMMMGSYAAALAKFESILKCSTVSNKIRPKAYLTACRSKNFPKAKRYFRGLPEGLAQICLKEGFDPRKDP